MKTNKSISKKITTTILIVCFSALLITGIIIVKTVSTRFKDNKRQILNETALSISNKAEVFWKIYYRCWANGSWQKLTGFYD